MGTRSIDHYRDKNAHAFDSDDVLNLLENEPRSKLGKELVRKTGVLGRKLGAKARRQEREAGWLMMHHKSPVERLLSITDMHPADLAAFAECKIAQALDIQIRAGAAAAPYVAQKQPIAVDMTNRQVVYLSIAETAPKPLLDASVATVVTDAVFQEIGDDEPQNG